MYGMVLQGKYEVYGKKLKAVFRLVRVYKTELKEGESFLKKEVKIMLEKMLTYKSNL